MWNSKQAPLHPLACRHDGEHLVLGPAAHLLLQHLDLGLLIEHEHSLQLMPTVSQLLYHQPSGDSRTLQDPEGLFAVFG